MKDKGDNRSAISGKKIKMKVKKSSQDKKVCYFKKMTLLPEKQLLKPQSVLFLKKCVNILSMATGV